MKRVCLYPFCSQQSKSDRKFLLRQDSGLQWLRFLAKQLAEDGVEIAFVLPAGDQCADFAEFCLQLPHCVLLTHRTPLDNMDRRFHWDALLLRNVAETCDAVITHHEFVALPLRALHPRLRIISECVFTPETAWPHTAELFPLAWRAADNVLCSNTELCERVRAAGARAAVTRYAYDASIAYPRGPASQIDVDVVFPVRGSATNFTNHKLFVEALKDSGLRVVCTDPTRYLRVTNEAPRAWLPQDGYTREQYVDLLHRSKVVVCLTENGSAGTALYEAIACGCRPVTLDLPQYRELGVHHLCGKTPAQVLGAVRSALASSLPIPEVSWASYQAAYPVVKETLLCS